MWIGGFVAALAYVMFRDRGTPAGALAAGMVVTATLVVSVVVDRRRRTGHRLLIRRHRLSSRRIAALLLTLLLIGGAVVAVAENWMHTMRKSAEDEVVRASKRDQKRGWY